MKPATLSRAILCCALAMFCSAWAGAGEAPAAAAPLDVAIAQAADSLARFAQPRAVVRLGEYRSGSILQGYTEHMLAARLHARGINVSALVHDQKVDGHGLPDCLLQRLRRQGVDLFAQPSVSGEQGARRLSLYAYRASSGERCDEFSVDFHVPPELEALVSGEKAPPSEQDQKWIALFEKMFPNSSKAGEGIDALQVARADNLFDANLWKAAGVAYMDAAPEPVSRPFARGIIAYELGGESGLAGQALQEALNQHPDNGPLYALSGWLALRQNRPEDALMLLEHARLGDIAREGLYIYARALALQGQDDQAAGKLLMSAASLLEDQLFAQLAAGRFCWSKADLPNALEYYRRATRTPHCNAETWMELAMLLDARGDVDGAIEALRSASRLEADNAAVARHLAGLLRRKGRHMEALAALRRAAEANPCSPSLLVAYGDGAMKMWRLDEAERQFRSSQTVSDDFPYGQVRLAAALGAQRRYHEAQSLLNQVLTGQPDYQPARIELGRLLAAQGRFQEAISALSEAARDAKYEATARLAMSGIYGRIGQPEAAIREAQIAVSCEDADSSYAALSKAFLAAGKSDKAEAAALSALKKNSRSVEAHLALAALRQARRQDEAALDEASAALKIDPYSVEALELKGTIFQQEGRPVECAMLWGRALELNRWDARLHLKMSWLLATELYEWQMALEHYNRYAELTSPRSQTPEPHDPGEEQRDGMD